ncbi:protein 4.1b isoform X15 [Anguilla anguilla]|uniref:protein 4.1b isoform X15 n=1 Tax=Anguilla anguilla TaxID=7936 RepID=UPI0015AA66AB|nr:protein 4.1b isoform X15 [Anguilla anguilla]
MKSNPAHPSLYQCRQSKPAGTQTQYNPAQTQSKPAQTQSNPAQTILCVFCLHFADLSLSSCPPYPAHGHALHGHTHPWTRPPLDTPSMVMCVAAMTTEASPVGEPESQPQSGRQEAEPVQDPPPPGPPAEPVLKPRTRTSAGRGLSRLFSSFLKRRSQCSDGEGAEAEPGPEEAGQEEELVKAPIADPEPELRTEGDHALDLHSLSSAETQAAHEDQKEDADTAKEKEAEEEGGAAGEKEKEEQPSEVKEGEGEESQEKGEEPKQEEPKGEEPKAADEPKSSKAVRRPRTMRCLVTLLDRTLYECELDKHAKGQELFNKVCDHLNLLERDYYGLASWDTPSLKTWLDFTKEIRKQVPGSNYNFTFNVKFYPPDPAQLSEDITRYYLCLQVREDILSGRLHCSFATLALLGSYALQSELGEYDPHVHSNEYASQVQLAPGQSKELEEKMMELHRNYRSMSPAQADMFFLENAKKLAMYGVDLHQAKDLEGVDIMLGVCSSGLMVYKDKLRINRFSWPKVLKISYKRSSFFIKIRPSEQEQYESTIGFKLPNYRASKKLWKVCVEHHTFFRLTSVEATTPRKFLALGSKFRYSGRTQAQSRQASSLIDRPAPLFQRSASKRASHTLDGAAGVAAGKARPVSAPVISPADLASVGLGPAPSTTPRAPPSAPPSRLTPQEDRKVEVKLEPAPVEEVVKVVRREKKAGPVVTAANGERPAESPPATEELVRMRKKRAKKIEGETIYIRHSNLMLEDLDKTQDEVMRHHASISELKRNFMASVPEPRPSEWDKRLSAHSPFRSASTNGAPPPTSPASACAVPVRTEMCTNLPREAPGNTGQGGGALSPPTQEGLKGLESGDDGKEQEEGLSRDHPCKPMSRVELYPNRTPEPETQAPAMQPPPGPEEEPCPPAEHERPPGVVAASPAELFLSNGPYLIRCFQPPLVKTQTVTLSEASNSLLSEITTKEVPIIHTETKTITYESAQPSEPVADSDPGVLLSAQTITSETVSKTTTTQITKMVKGGLSETRIEKRIVITGDPEIDHDQALAEAIKEAKEQHPDMSVTKVVVHQETEITPPPE